MTGMRERLKALLRRASPGTYRALSYFIAYVKVGMRRRDAATPCSLPSTEKTVGAVGHQGLEPGPNSAKLLPFGSRSPR